MSEHVVYPITVWDPKNGIVSWCWWDPTKASFWDSRNRRRRIYPMPVRHVAAAEAAADTAMAPDEDRDVKTSRARDSVRRSYSFTVPLSNAVSGKLVEVKLASYDSALTVERLKRSVVRQWKQSEGLDHLNWRAVEILVSEADARVLKGEEDVKGIPDPVSGQSLQREVEGRACGSSDSDAEVEDVLQSPVLVPLEPDELELNPEKYAVLFLTSSEPCSSDAVAPAEDGGIRLHFLVRGGFARFESRRQLSAALRTMQAAEQIESVDARFLIDDRSLLVNRSVVWFNDDDLDYPYGWNSHWFLSERGYKRARLGNTLLERNPELSDAVLDLREYTTAETNTHASAEVRKWSRKGEVLIHRRDFSRVLAGKRAIEEVYGPLSMWDVSGVADLSFLFAGWANFCGDVSGWNVCGVRSMRGMFGRCHGFNSNLAGWDVSTVRDFGFMFWRCVDFNQSLSSWRVHSDAYLAGMFEGAVSLTPASVASLDSWALKIWSGWQVESMFSQCGLRKCDWCWLPRWLCPFSAREALRESWQSLESDAARFFLFVRLRAMRWRRDGPEDLPYLQDLPFVFLRDWEEEDEEEEVEYWSDSDWEDDDYNYVPPIFISRRRKVPRRGGKIHEKFRKNRA